MNNILGQMMGNMKGMTVENSSKWYHQFSYTEIFDFNCAKLINLAKNALLFQALFNGNVVFEKCAYIIYNDHKKVISLLEELGIKLVYQTSNNTDLPESIFCVMDTGAVYVAFSNTGLSRLVVVSTGENVMKQILNKTQNT